MSINSTSGVSGSSDVSSTESNQQTQLSKLWSDYQGFLNSGDILKGQPNDSLKTEIEQKYGQIQQLINSGADASTIDAALRELNDKIHGDSGLQLKSKMLASLETLYSKANQSVYFTSGDDVHKRYSELKSLLENGASVEEINPKMSDFKTLLNGGRLSDGSGWSFTAAEKDRQAAMNKLHGLAMAGNLTFARNEFSSLEAERKADEKMLAARESGLRTKGGVMAEVAGTRAEHAEKARKLDAAFVEKKIAEKMDQNKANDINIPRNA